MPRQEHQGFASRAGVTLGALEEPHSWTSYKAALSLNLETFSYAEKSPSKRFEAVKEKYLLEKEGMLQTWGLAKTPLVWSCVRGLTDEMDVGWQCLCVSWLLLLTSV